MFAQDLTITYDPDKLEFVSADSLKDEFMIVNKADKPGQIRIVAASVGETATNANGALMVIHWKAKPMLEPTTAMLALSKVTVADAQGNETQLPGDTRTIQIQLAVSVDKTALSTLIADAQTKHDAAVEGTNVGQHPVGSKATLQAAIDRAQVVFNDSEATQLQVDQAVADLDVALQAFNASAVLPMQGRPEWRQ